MSAAVVWMDGAKPVLLRISQNGIPISSFNSFAENTSIYTTLLCLLPHEYKGTSSLPTTNGRTIQESYNTPQQERISTFLSANEIDDDDHYNDGFAAGSKKNISLATPHSIPASIRSSCKSDVDEERVIMAM